jgi:thiol-disulfide isomerase/thioredoxin
MQNKIIMLFIALLAACTSAKDVGDSQAMGCSGDGTDEFVYAIDTVDPPSPENETGGTEYPFAIWEDCGGNVGDHPCNLTLTDQNGEPWSLYDQYGKVIVLDFSTMWCGVCVRIAQEGDEFTATYGSENFVWATVLIEDSSGGEVDQSDLQLWILQTSTTMPVLAGSRDLIDPTAEEGYPISAWPTLVVIGKDMVITHGQIGWNEDWIHQAVQAAL